MPFSREAHIARACDAGFRHLERIAGAEVKIFRISGILMRFSQL